MEEEIDLSKLPYDEWVAFFFDRKPPPEDSRKRHEIDIWKHYDFVFLWAHPEILLEHLTRLCNDFGGIVERFSWPQIDQGVWAIFINPAGMDDLVVSKEYPLELRLRCIRSMYHVYADGVTQYKPDEPMDNCFYMWWDILGSNFCYTHGHRSDNVFIVKDPGERRIHDAMLETLKRILALKDDHCQIAALHGLGHLHHPAGGEVISRFMKKHRNEWTEEGIQWLEQCRDGSVM